MQISIILLRGWNLEPQTLSSIRDELFREQSEKTCLHQSPPPPPAHKTAAQPTRLDGQLRNAEVAAV